MTTWFENAVLALGHFLWQGCVMAALLAVGLRRYRNAQDRYGILVGGLCAMLAMPFLNGIVLSLVPREPFDMTLRIYQGGISPSQLIFWGWVAGFALCVARYPLAWLRIGLTLRHQTVPACEEMTALVANVSRSLGFNRDIRVLESTFDLGPATFGILKHVLIVPASMVSRLSPSQLEAIVAHEIAHMMRNDFAVNLLQGFAESLLFFHPAVWWISGQIRREREHCCDDLALSHIGSPKTYAYALLGLAEAYQPSLAMNAKGGDLHHRVRRLRSGNPFSRPQTSRRVTTTLVGTLLALFVVGVWAVPAKNPPVVHAKDVLMAGTIQRTYITWQPVSPVYRTFEVVPGASISNARSMPAMPIREGFPTTKVTFAKAQPVIELVNMVDAARTVERADGDIYVTVYDAESIRPRLSMRR